MQNRVKKAIYRQLAMTSRPNWSKTRARVKTRSRSNSKARQVTFYYRAKIGHAELSRLDGAAYALHIDELTDRRRAEYTVQRLNDCIRFEKTGELYELLSSSLTQSVSIDKLQKSFDDRPDIWNAIYAALAAQPKFDLQINHKSAHCQASDHKIALVVEDGIWKIADIEGVF